MSKYISVNDRFVYFWNEWPDIWYPAEFDVEVNSKKCHFFSAGHYFYYMKAITFGDEEISRQILEDSDPERVVSLGYKVQGFDPDVWQEKCSQIMLDANVFKYSQNEDLKRLLLSPEYEGRIFVRRTSSFVHPSYISEEKIDTDLYKWHNCKIFGHYLYIGIVLNKTRSILLSKECSPAY